MDKTLIAIILCILLLAGIPLVCQLTKEPEPLTVDKIKDAYRAQNFSVANERTISRPGYQADAEIFRTSNGAKVHLFTYSNLEVSEQERIKMEVDVASSLPDYQPKNIATTVRNKYYVLLIICENPSLRDRIAKVFQPLVNPGPPPPPPPDESVRRRHF